ncbi:GLPGLI family protein [Chryseobacterium arthrosphaerae]|uniref:GLPGLI family protein n=1 Tax=Chryseobacterium arthrosphaerae TaxID=651561 RepID=UPI001F4A4DC3|nr:GLPGLI family protein [Chryseobacterium arthrosphaerae]
MMKNLLVVGFLQLYALLFSQNGKAVMQITYETRIISDSLNRQHAQQYEMVLLCNATESVYYSPEAKNYYTRSDKTAGVVTTAGVIPKYPKTEYSIYKSDHTLTAFLPVGKYIFRFQEPDLKWEILNDTKKVQNYHCRLAQTTTDTGDIFFAWYTEDIPIPEGPFRFKGLSGMVLEVYNKSRTIEISAASIQKNEETISPLPYTSVVKAKTKKQYLEARKNYIDNPSLYNGNIKIFDAAGKEITHKIKERLQKINVFLD